MCVRVVFTAPCIATAMAVQTASARGNSDCATFWQRTLFSLLTCSSLSGWPQVIARDTVTRWASGSSFLVEIPWHMYASQPYGECDYKLQQRTPTKYAWTSATHFAKYATFHSGYMTSRLLLILVPNEQLSPHGSPWLRSCAVPAVWLLHYTIQKRHPS